MAPYEPWLGPLKESLGKSLDNWDNIVQIYRRLDLIHRNGW